MPVSTTSIHPAALLHQPTGPWKGLHHLITGNATAPSRSSSHFTAASVLPLIKEGHKCTSSWTCGDSEWMTKPLLPSGLPGRGPLFECVRCRVQTGLQRRRGPFRAGSRWRFTGRWVRSRWGEEAVWVYACVCVGSPRRKGTPLRSSPVKLDACGGGEKKKKHQRLLWQSNESRSRRTCMEIRARNEPQRRQGKRKWVAPKGKHAGRSFSIHVTGGYACFSSEAPTESTRTVLWFFSLLSSGTDHQKHLTSNLNTFSFSLMLPLFWPLNLF